AAVLVRQRDDGLAADEARASGALDSHLVGVRRLLVAERDLALESSFHTADAHLHRGLVLVGSDCFELFAARNGFLENLGILKRRPYFLARRRHLVRPLELTRASPVLPRSCRIGKGCPPACQAAGSGMAVATSPIGRATPQ